MKRRGFFRKEAKSSSGSAKSGALSEDEADRSIPDRSEIEGDWSLGDEMKMGLG